MYRDLEAKEEGTEIYSKGLDNAGPYESNPRIWTY